MNRLTRALMFVKNVDANYDYIGSSPLEKISYLNHAVEVSDIILKAVHDIDEDVLIAAVLYKVVNDYDIPSIDIQYNFGQNVSLRLNGVIDNRSFSSTVQSQLMIKHASTRTFEYKLIVLSNILCMLQTLVVKPSTIKMDEMRMGYIVWCYSLVEEFGYTGIHYIDVMFHTYFYTNISSFDKEVISMQLGSYYELLDANS